MQPSLILVLMTALLVAAASPVTHARDGQSAIECEKAFDERDLRELFAGGVPVPRLRQLVTECGLAVTVPDGASLETRLRDLGASTAAIAALSPPTGAAAGTRWASLDRREMSYIPPG